MLASTREIPLAVSSSARDHPFSVTDASNGLFFSFVLGGRQHAKCTWTSCMSAMVQLYAVLQTGPYTEGQGGPSRNT